ncbi:interleukin-8-like [Labrus mixtus]|uniref:interleukin-8-like n=1 Tax=Labrus mixtus TaxID=508554 RepID=UPI0029C061A7|nr:interleukin-8-like [Labrus mixtus]
MSVVSIVALLVFLAVPQGDASEQVIPRCQCINNEKRTIGRHIGQVQVIQPNSHCPYMEIIATLKTDGITICLDPNLPWVKRTLESLRAQQRL